MAMEARNVELEDKIKSITEKFDIENERLEVLAEELAELRKKVKAFKDMDDKTEAKIALDDEFDRFGKELRNIRERQKVITEEWAELWKEERLW